MLTDLIPIQPVFGSLYFSFDECKRGFSKGCKPFVGVDGCHLKTTYGGQLLIVVGSDPNDQCFSLRLSVVKPKTKERWMWFLKILMGDIDQYIRYSFI